MGLVNDRKDYVIVVVNDREDNVIVVVNDGGGRRQCHSGGQ